MRTAPYIEPELEAVGRLGAVDTIETKRVTGDIAYHIHERQHTGASCKGDINGL